MPGDFSRGSLVFAHLLIGPSHMSLNDLEKELNWIKKNPRFNHKKTYLQIIIIKTYLHIIIIVEFQLHKFIHCINVSMPQEKNIVRKAGPYFNFCCPQITGRSPKYVGICFPAHTGLRWCPDVHTTSNQYYQLQVIECQRKGGQ